MTGYRMHSSCKRESLNEFVTNHIPAQANATHTFYETHYTTVGKFKWPTEDCQ